MDRNQVIASVAGDLHATEAAIDEAIVRATAMVQGVIGARAPMNVSALAFAASQTKMMETLAVLSSAREAIVATHEELAKDHRRMGWGVYAAGTMDKPDGDAQRPTSTNRLRAV